MKKTITISAIVCTLVMNAQTKINYPETKKIPAVNRRDIIDTIG